MPNSVAIVTGASRASAGPPPSALPAISQPWSWSRAAATGWSRRPTSGVTEGLRWELAHLLASLPPETEWTRFLPALRPAFPVPLPKTLGPTRFLVFDEGWKPLMAQAEGPAAQVLAIRVVLAEARRALVLAHGMAGAVRPLGDRLGLCRTRRSGRGRPDLAVVLRALKAVGTAQWPRPEHCLAEVQGVVFHAGGRSGRAPRRRLPHRFSIASFKFHMSFSSGAWSSPSTGSCRRRWS